MTEQAPSADWNAQPHQLGMQALWRLAIWGCLATFALFVAVISAYSSAGSRQLASATSGPQPAGQDPSDQGAARLSAGVNGPRASDAEEMRHLAETVRALAADRDQTLERIAALERNVDNFTGSIKRTAAPQPAASATVPPIAPPAIAPAPISPPETLASTSAVARPEPPTPAVQVAITTAPAAPQPFATQGALADTAPTPAPEAVVRTAAAGPLPAALPTTGEPAAADPLGIDVGGAINYDGLRTLWHSTKLSAPAAMEELYPLVAVRENSKTRGVDLRLVVGPITDVESASQLCLALSVTHHYCQPVAFEGQRLSLNEPGSNKATLSHHAAAKAEGKSDTKPDVKDPALHITK